VRRTTLPNGRPAYEHLSGETDVLVKELWVRDAYLAPEPRVTLEPGAVVFDVGANIGLFSLHIDERCGGDVTLFAFEPIPAIAAICEANARDHFRGTQMRVFPVALSREAGEATFLYHPKMSIWSTGSPSLDVARSAQLLDDVPGIVRYVTTTEKPWLRWLPRWLLHWGGRLVARAAAETVPVQVTLRTLSDVLDEVAVDCIDLLKVDVEGAEEDVLAGLRDDHWPRVRQLVLEVEDAATLTRLRETLHGRGFVTSHRLAMDVHETGVPSELTYLWAWREADGDGETMA